MQILLLSLLFLWAISVAGVVWLFRHVAERQLSVRDASLVRMEEQLGGSSLPRSPA